MPATPDERRVSAGLAPADADRAPGRRRRRLRGGPGARLRMQPRASASDRVPRSATWRTCERSGLTTEQLIYSGRAAGWLVVPSLEPLKPDPESPFATTTMTLP